MEPDLYSLLYAVFGLIIGVLITYWAALVRARKVDEQWKAHRQAEETIRLEKSQYHQDVITHIKSELAQLQDRYVDQQTRFNKLTAAHASLEAQNQRIPFLERELTDLKSTIGSLQQDLRRESAELARAQEKNQQLVKTEKEKQQHTDQIGQLQEQLSGAKTQIAELGSKLTLERQQAVEKIALLNDAREQLKTEFQNLAHSIFEDKSQRFADQNRISMEQLLTPLRDQLGDFKKRVEDVYDKESRDRTALQTEIIHLKELNRQISKEALNLTRALKGDSKARGDWGEVILERVLEASGLQKGREYDVQVSLKNKSGRRYQPDVIVHLPEGKDVIIDSKMSLKAYETYYSAEEVQEKEAALKAHIQSVRNHIQDLAGKCYENLEGICSLDFILMFIPIEAAFLAAVDRDRNLFNEAFEKNIMVVSPSTLLVTLRTIHNIWRYEYQNRFAMEIATKAGGLYDKFVGFTESLEEIGRQLDRAQTAYRTTRDRLTSGKGNLVRRTEQLKELGVKASKKLNPHLIEEATTEETQQTWEQ